MTTPQKMLIKSTDDFLLWLDTGRRLAHNVLRDAGASPALIRSISEKPMRWYGAPNVSAITDPVSRAKLTFTDEVAAAVLMLDCCDSVSAKVQDPATPPHLLVREGYNLATYEDAMKAAHWAAEAEREKQRKRATPTRGPRIPAAMVKNLRSRGMTWGALKKLLPSRVGKSVEVGGYGITFNDAGRLIVTHNKKSSRPVTAEALREYFKRD